MATVFFKTLDNKNNVLKDSGPVACFRDISYNTIPKNVAKILVYSSNFLYDNPEKWLNFITELGFPVYYKKKGKVHNVTLELSEYVYKSHLMSALTLVRYLIESPFYKIINNTFQCIEEFNIEPFTALLIGEIMCKEGNDNHRLTFGDLSYISKEEVFANFEKHAKVYDRAEKLSAPVVVCWTQNRTVIHLRNNFKPNTIFDKMLNKKVYVVGGDENYVNWLTDYKITNKLEDADLVVFTGGEDVSPILYNENVNPRTYSNLKRDKAETVIYNKVVKLKTPMLGICRGSQFLCVMNGGRLVQHQENPKAVHEIESTYGKFSITSTHHQAAFPFNLHRYDYSVIGWTQGISSIHEDGFSEEMNPPKECEIVYYPKTLCLGIQGHPEMTSFQRTYPESMDILKKIFKDFINNNLKRS